jgi:acyl-CoA thioesterase
VTYSTLIDSASFVDGRLSLTIPEAWMQGRTTYGGLSAALCLEAALQTFTDLPPLRSATVSFIGPAGGAVEARAKLLRRGKSVSFVEAEVSGEKGLATRCVFAFGGVRESALDQSFTPAPTLPAPEECEAFMPKDVRPAFARHFDTRLAKGARPISGAREHDIFVWVRHKVEGAETLPALLALADMPPPAVLAMFTAPAPISTMTWMVNFLTDRPTTRDGWWLLQSRADNASQGYSSQDMLVWNRDGELVIAGRQSVAIFF